MQSEVYTVADIQKLLKIGRDSAYELVKQDSFPSIKIKNQYRIPKESFYEWLNKKTK